MNAKDIAEMWVTLDFEDRKTIVAQAYLSQEKKIEGLVEALEKVKEGTAPRVGQGLYMSHKDINIIIWKALTAYKEER